MTFLVASAEGAVVLARAQQVIEPFKVIADQLIEQAAALPTGGVDEHGSSGIGDEDASEASARRRLLTEYGSASAVIATAHDPGLAVEFDGEGGVGDVHGDGLVLVGSTQRDVLAADHDHAGV